MDEIMIDPKSLKTLEFHKVLAKLETYTSFSGGAGLVRELMPTSYADEAQARLRETGEARAMIEAKVNLTLGGVYDVRDLAAGSKRSVIIEPGDLLNIRSTLRRATTIKRTLGRMKQQYPLLSDLAQQAEECIDLQDAIGSAIEDTAEVKDSASARLAIIRREMQVAFDRLQTRLNRLLNVHAKSGYLQEQLITTRNGRYVIPIKADHKGKIPGIVHDSSSSGATLFIEPIETVELNNKWREMQLEEEKEIRRILLALTDLVGEVSDKIVRTVEVLSHIDLVMAKAQYADAIKATEPTLVPFAPKRNASPKTEGRHPGSTIELRGAKHPLLKGNVVPIDIEFDADTWVMVITGPNTGGKTVALKTVGLMVALAQAGLHLPAEYAKLSVFDALFADIGDEQSIEQSLSTFSAHLTNTIRILDDVDEKSLVLLDELGAGTDPAEGSALARAVLSHLLDRRVTTMVTTHHPELKIYSVETPGVRNASVEFDLETLAPTYRLVVGLPGRSNALAIARRLGLREDIINAARDMVATEDLIADDLLDEINRTRDNIRRQNAELTALRQELKEDRDNLQARLDKIEDERRDIINTARRNAETDLADIQKEIKRLRNDLRTAGLPLETLRAIQTAAERLAAQNSAPVQNVTEAVERSDWRPRLGDTVWLATLNAEGVVNEVSENEVLVQVGKLRVRADLSELSKRDASLKRQMKRGQTRVYEETTDPVVTRGKSPGLELDLRGQRVETALERVDWYVDAAYTAGLPFARIIHGKGTGALRKAIRDFVEHHRLISKVETAHPNEGGDGVTVIHMVPTS
ncbi:MAG: endonuclease MutS2 [Chloroflexi bacterium]|nr:endonuclease MutS2 [Chloroflexota bacterium]